MFADFKIPIQILYCVESIEVNGKKMKDKGRDCRETIVISKKELLELTKGKQLDKELLSFFSSKNLRVLLNSRDFSREMKAINNY